MTCALIIAFEITSLNRSINNNFRANNQYILFQ